MALAPASLPTPVSGSASIWNASSSTWIEYSSLALWIHRSTSTEPLDGTGFESVFRNACECADWERDPRVSSTQRFVNLPVHLGTYPSLISSRCASSASACRLPSAVPKATLRGGAKTSQIPASDVRACLEVSDTAEPARPSPLAVRAMLPSPDCAGSALRMNLTVFNTLPTRAAVNASPAASQRRAHDSRKSMDRFIRCPWKLSLSGLRQLAWLFALQ